MLYACPHKNLTPFTLKEVLDMLDHDKAFATFFAKTLQAASAGDHDAIDCVDSYLEPT